jgi:hypothetical protein
MTDYYAQAGYPVRFDWGTDGADAVAPGAAYVAVVDVLTFTTTLTVAVGRAARLRQRAGADRPRLPRRRGGGRRTDSPAVPVLTYGWFRAG